MRDSRGNEGENERTYEHKIWEEPREGEGRKLKLIKIALSTALLTASMICHRKTFITLIL